MYGQKKLKIKQFLLKGTKKIKAGVQYRWMGNQKNYYYFKKK